MPVALDVAGAHVLVVGRHRVDDVLQREAERHQLGRVGRNVDLPLEAAHRVDFGHPWRVAHLRPDDPILQGAQVGGGPRSAVVLGRPGRRVDGVHEDLAQTCRDRPHFGLQPFWNL